MTSSEKKRKLDLTSDIATSESIDFRKSVTKKASFHTTINIKSTLVQPQMMVVGDVEVIQSNKQLFSHISDWIVGILSLGHVHASIGRFPVRSAGIRANNRSAVIYVGGSGRRETDGGRASQRGTNDCLRFGDARTSCRLLRPFLHVEHATNVETAGIDADQSRSNTTTI